MPTAGVASSRAVTSEIAGAAGVRDHGGRAVLLLVLAALAGELLLVAARLWLGLPWGVVLAAHIGLVAALAVWMARAQPAAGRDAPAMPHDATPAALALLMVAAAGPLGALAALALPWLATGRRSDDALLGAWYDRIALAGEIDRETKLADDIVSGRTMNLAGPAPQSFARVMADGTLAERQTVLGLIARQFHPSYLPALAMALKSSEPVVRVQAAAVAARVRGGLKDRVRVLIDKGRRGEALAAGERAELTAAAASVLVDEGDRIAAAALAEAGPSAGAADPRAFRLASRRARLVARGYRVRARPPGPTRGEARR